MAEAGGAHRSIDSTSTRRNLLAVGGAVALAGQMAFSHMVGASTAVLPDTTGLLGVDPAESTIIELSQTAPIAPTARGHDGLEPVSLGSDPVEMHQTDAAQLAKASGLAEAAQRAEQARAAAAADTPRVRGSKCAPDRTGLAGVRSWVSTAGTQLRCIFGVGSIGGIGSRGNVSDHPRGLALDFMLTGKSGDDLADYALRYGDELKIKYVIWKQRINYADGGGWQRMPSRGGATANHFDHVHISFRA